MVPLSRFLSTAAMKSTSNPATMTLCLLAIYQAMQEGKWCGSTVGLKEGYVFTKVDIFNKDHH